MMEIILNDYQADSHLILIYNNIIFTNIFGDLKNLCIFVKQNETI